ncbi:uncharacterized protein LOC111358728 [Spodoptera litura]|uniref:Uncharacterized protein LOC111358728 n=1 Tax=Spodoptera litura TaxID=69820 RepID=A0A9J7EKR2_SPOLT|nr:uncharacterized protein LOC111358728 [Spodoptera litura]
MYNLPGDFLMTYDSDLSEHSDSSDFDGTSNSTLQQRKKQKVYWKSFRPKSKRDANTPTCSSSYTVTQNSSREIWETQTISQNGGTLGVKVRKTYKNKTCKTLDGGDQIETVKSKRASTRRKVMPCLSCMFGRSSNNVKQMSIIKENPTENVNIDTGCQATNVNGEHKIRKFNRSQQLYAVQPVYAVEGNVHAKSSPLQHTKIVREPLLNRKTVRNEKSNAWCFTSSSDDNEYRFVQREIYKKHVEKPSKNRHKMNTDVREEYHTQKESKGHKNAEQQCSTNVNRNYEVYTYPCLNRSNTGGAYTATGPNCPKNELPDTCSGFWEYFFTKLNSQQNQNQNQSNTNARPCKCRTESSSNVCKPCDKSLCTRDLSQGSQTGVNKKPTCDCSTTFSRNASMHASEAPPSRVEPRDTSQEGPRSKLKREKVYCKCYPEKKKPQYTSSKEAGPENYTSAPTHASTNADNEGTRPCQLSHTDITESLSQKYNGEILCIHNPPCVLINGCLNLPPAKEEVTMDTWRTSTPQTYKFCSSPRSTYFQKQPSTQFRVQTCQQNPYLIRDSGCQYSSSIIGIQSSNKWKSNEGFQYQNSSIVKPASVIDGSCQYRPSPYELQNQKTAVNDVNDENFRKYRISSNEIQKLKAVNESCQYWLSPTEMEKGQNDNIEGCFYCRETPTDVKKLITHSKEKLKPAGIDFRVPKPRKEKIIQCVCNHNPPCEVVRTCCKAKFDPKIQNSCVHVPMCEKVPLCVLELKNQNEAFQSCQHRPKCVEVPICTRNYIVLTAREEVATQSQSKCKMVCRHEPPCVMIQSCLARVCDSCIPCDAIPDCVHHPKCEMIPACCRKSAKEMVSVHTQYPNQCSLV